MKNSENQTSTKKSLRLEKKVVFGFSNEIGTKKSDYTSPTSWID